MANILIVDDDHIIRQNLTDILEQIGGHDVLAAKDGFECLELARANAPDLIICDVEMPRLDGYGVVEALQQDTATATIPFIFLTGRSDKISMRQGMTLGADDYLPKPFHIDELMNAVNTRLAKRELIEEHYESKLETLRDNILLAVPHELRTPLSLIIGYSGILKQGPNNLPPAQVSLLGSKIFDAGQRLQHSFENYIIYAQIELLLTEPDRVAKMRQIRDARPNEVAKATAQLYMEKYGRIVQLSLNAPDSILPISTNNLEKVLEELMDNAFKFSPPDTAVSLTTDTTDKYFTIVISNVGKGMTQAQIRDIGVYMQFERKIHEQQGSGMGLIIAKRLVELYGGHLTIESEPGTVTHVTVHLPV